MSPLGILDTDVTVTAVPRFSKSSPALWDAIVDQLAPRDPARTAPSWPAQPVLPQAGMFDFVRS